MEIKLHYSVAKIILRFNNFTRWKVMCLGYGEDYEQFTELVWEDDKYLNFSDIETYPKFQLWFV